MESITQIPMGFFQSLFDVFLALSFWLLLGVGVAAALHAFLPQNLLARALGGRAGVLKAVIIGIPLPLCSCGVIPTAIGLKKDGASKGASLGFLIATPQTGVDSIMVSAGFLGWPFALFKLAAALVTGLLGGLLTDWQDPEYRNKTSTPKPPLGPAPGLFSGIRHGLDTLESIWVWLVVGILVSAAIKAIVPPQHIQSFANLGPLATSLVMLAVSLPSYVCSTASVPMAAALVAGGLPPAAAMVFLMAGPAVSSATLGAVFKSFGRRITLIYLAVVALSSLTFALLFQSLLPLGANLARPAEHQGPMHWLSAAVLAVLILHFAFKSARRFKTSPTAPLSMNGESARCCSRPTPASTKAPGEHDE